MDSILENNNNDDIFNMEEISVDKDTGSNPSQSSSAGSNHTSTNSSETKSSYTKKESYWDKTAIDPMPIDVANFNKKGKSFTIHTFPDKDLPEDAEENIIKLAKGLMAAGYTFRHTGASDDEIQNKIIRVVGADVVSYIPWKGFNKMVNYPILPTPEGYKTAITVHKAFAKIPPAVRAILARNVNAMLGEKANDPVDMILVWDATGVEALGKGVKFDEIGTLPFILQVATKANIPVFNVKNTDVLERIKDVVASAKK